MSERHPDGRLLRSSASSATRVMKDKASVAAAVGDGQTKKRLKDVVKPNSMSGALRKAGVALILAPDPITAVPGVVMLGASVAMRNKKPLTPASVLDEAQKMIDEIGTGL